MAKTQAGLELYKAGDRVPNSGEYCIVDAQGNKLDYDLVTLDEGESFPALKESNLFYSLNDTCLDESCEVIGERTPEVE